MLISKPVRFPHRIQATQDIPLGDGRTIPTGTQGWLIGHTHIWNEPDVDFDGFGICGISGGMTKAVRVNGRLVRE